MIPKLTIGMCHFHDFDSTAFTVQSLFMYHEDVIDNIEILIIDNDCKSTHSVELEKFCSSLGSSVRYIKFEEFNSSSTVRNKIFEYAKGEYVLNIDCHVLLPTGSVRELINYFDDGLDDGNLLMGPLLNNLLQPATTHYDPVWRGGSYGIWACDRNKLKDGIPFEIFAHGIGCYACRKSSWLGFNPSFRGFGGCESYIAEKYRAHNKKVICLPFLKWWHKFPKPNGTMYSVTYEDRIRNYILGRLELGIPYDDIIEYYSTIIPKSSVMKYEEDAKILHYAQL